MTLGTWREMEKEWMIAGQSHKNRMVDSRTDSLGETDREPNIYPFSLIKLKQ